MPRKEPASAACWPAGLVGGAVALGAGYGLTRFGGDGDTPAIPQEVIDRLAALEQGQGENAQAAAELDRKIADALASGGVTPQQLADLRALVEEIGADAVSGREELARTLAAVQGRTEDLGSRLDAIAASGVDGATPEAIAGIEAAIASLRSDIETLRAAGADTAAAGETLERLDGLDARISGLERDVAGLKDAAAALDARHRRTVAGAGQRDRQSRRRARRAGAGAGQPA